jgi:hypothetical protein
MNKLDYEELFNTDNYREILELLHSKQCEIIDHIQKNNESDEEKALTGQEIWEYAEKNKSNKLKKYYNSDKYDICVYDKKGQFIEKINLNEQVLAEKKIDDDLIELLKWYYDEMEEEYTSDEGDGLRPYQEKMHNKAKKWLIKLKQLGGIGYE